MPKRQFARIAGRRFKRRKSMGTEKLGSVILDREVGRMMKAGLGLR
jgi:hypothetical protein